MTESPDPTPDPARQGPEDHVSEPAPRPSRLGSGDPLAAAAAAAPSPAGPGGEAAAEEDPNRWTWTGAPEVIDAGAGGGGMGGEVEFAAAVALPTPPEKAGATPSERALAAAPRVVDVSLLGTARIGLPLVLAASALAVRLFSDRVMLARVSREEFAASLSAGVTWFMFASFWIGLIAYAATFVAQYTGAGRPERVGRAIWQGFVLAVVGGAVMASGYWWCVPMFEAIDHGDAVLERQVVYFRILALNSPLPLFMAALNGFWSGRGRTWVVAGLEWLGVGVNLAGNYVLIFGKFGFPALGIMGAAYATVLGNSCAVVAALFLFWQRRNRNVFGTWPAIKLDPGLLWRLIRFGLPSGTSFILNVAAFNLFIQLVGRYGPVHRAASTMAFSMNAIAFIPMVGLGITTSILVGQGIGAGDVTSAKQAVRNARLLISVYMAALMLLFFGYADCIRWIFPEPTAAGSVPVDPEAVYAAGRLYLRFIAAFLLFDGIFILYENAIKGAGDTRFAMWMSVGLSWFGFALPCAALAWYGAPVWSMWTVMLIHIAIASGVFYWRYRGGAWQRMRVIED